ncbi:MAG: HAMP domain-containing histidine kinase [Clostridia bacterium]|nr:HAMP domain-containing histidine kinase [Clostridia bacterium]
MTLLRNREIRTELLIGAGATLLLAAIAFFVHPLAGVLLLVLGFGLTGVHLWFGARRYARIAALSQRINRILHGEEQLIVSESDEGELSILYHELHKMTVRLQEQTDRLAADKVQLTDAIADIFHQIRTPLTSITLGLTLLKEPELPYERRIALTRELLRQTERIRWLVETLLKLSKLDAGTAVFTPVAMEVRTLLERAVEPLSIAMELREIRFEMRVGSERLTCDPAWTAEAFGNLLKNATEHTPAGGTVTVEATETPLFTEITVSDTGDGFSEADLPRLFERFYRGKNASSDSIGIGLAFTREVLAAQNATIAASNQVGGGARFVVRFYKTIV